MRFSIRFVNVYATRPGGSYSILDLFRSLKENIGADVEPEFGAPRVGDVRHSKADISRAQEILGYEIVVPFEEGIRRTVRWYQEQRAGEEAGAIPSGPDAKP